MKAAGGRRYRGGRRDISIQRYLRTVCQLLLELCGRMTIQRVSAMAPPILRKRPITTKTAVIDGAEANDITQIVWTGKESTYR